MKRISLTFVLVCVMAFMLSSTCLAYNFTDYEFTDDGNIIVDDKGMDKESSAILYLYTDVNNRDIINVKNQYIFNCLNDPESGKLYTSLMYKFNPFNAKVYATLDNAEVWVWQFALENGEYDFSHPIGSTSYGSLPKIYTLTSNFEMLKYPDDYAGEPIESETLTLENEQIRLYAIYGDKAYREANMDAFIDWAKTTEASLKEIEDAVASTKIESQEVIEVESQPIETSNSKITDNKPVTEEAESQTEEPVLEEAVVEPESSAVNIINLLKGIGAVAILCFLGFYIGKRKDNEE